MCDSVQTKNGVLDMLISGSCTSRAEEALFQPTKENQS
jgi:hypothetical protein